MRKLEILFIFYDARTSGRRNSKTASLVSLQRASTKPEPSLPNLLSKEAKYSAHRWLEAHVLPQLRPRRQAEQCAWPQPAYCLLLEPEPSQSCPPYARLGSARLSPALPGAQRFSAPRQRKRTWAPPCATSRRGSCSSSSSRRCASRTTRSASPRRATRPARTSCRRGRRHRTPCGARVDGATPRRFFQWLYEHGIDVAAI